MKRNRAVIGICVVCFAIGMCLGGLAVRFERKNLSAEEMNQQGTWERHGQEPADSMLKDPEECCLCGNHNRSLMSMFRGRDDLGIICVNDWYVLDMQICDFDGTGGGGTGWIAGAEDACRFRTDRNPERGISEVTIEYGTDSIFDVKKVQSYLCQTCLDKLLEVMSSYGYEGEEAGAKDLCLVDFKTLELYSLQEHYISHYVRDYYIQVEGRDEEEMEVTGIYVPALENGERTEE